MSASRRGLLAALPAVALVPAGLPTLGTLASADAALIATCSQVIAAHRECEASFCYPPGTSYEEAEPYEERAHHFGSLSFEHAAEAAALPAATLAGAIAKSRAAHVLWAREPDGQLSVSDNAEWLVASALEDLLRLIEN